MEEDLLNDKREQIFSSYCKVASRTVLHIIEGTYPHAHISSHKAQHKKRTVVEKYVYGKFEVSTGDTKYCSTEINTNKHLTGLLQIFAQWE